MLPMIGEVVALESGTTVLNDYMTKISSFGGLSYFLNQSEYANVSRYSSHDRSALLKLFQIREPFM